MCDERRATSKRIHESMTMARRNLRPHDIVPTTLYQNGIQRETSDAKTAGLDNVSCCCYEGDARALE